MALAPEWRNHSESVSQSVGRAVGRLAACGAVVLDLFVFSGNACHSIPAWHGSKSHGDSYRNVQARRGSHIAVLLMPPSPTSPPHPPLITIDPLAHAAALYLRAIQVTTSLNESFFYCVLTGMMKEVFSPVSSGDAGAFLRERMGS